MARVEKLTPEQEAAIAPFVQRWVDRLDKGAPLDRDAATTGIKWLYNLCGLKEPQIVFVASPFGCQVARSILEQANKVVSQVGAQVGSQVGDQVRSQVGSQVRSQVGDQVLSQVLSQVRSQVWSQVWSQVRSQVGLENFEPYCYYGSFSQDAPWVAYIRFFQEQNICNIQHDKFEAFAKLIESNLYDAIQLDGLCICCEMPIEIHRDSTGRLHSTGGMAIKWSDGWGFHSLWGVRVPEELFERITSRKIAAKEVLSLNNIEHRTVALKFLGAENIINDCDSFLIKQSDKGNSLYSLKGITDQTEYALRYTCPSTGREYVSFIAPEVGSNLDPDLAMAWKFGLTKEQYLDMELES